MLDRILVLFCYRQNIRKIVFEDAGTKETWRQITGVVEL